MKKITTFLLLMLGVIVFGQNITPNQMGPFKVNAKLSEVEKISKQKIKFTKQQTEDYDYSKVLTVNGIEYTLYFYDDYDDKGNVTGKILGSVSSKSPKLKTAEGIGIGSTKNDIISAYPFADLGVYYEVGEDGVRSKTNCTVAVSSVNDSVEGAYSFDIKDNKVAGITVSNYDDAWD